MIAFPLNLKSVVNDLFLEDIDILQLFKQRPEEVDSFFTEVPWFFMERNDFQTLENENPTGLSGSAKRWNELKLDLHYHLFGDGLFQKKMSKDVDWEYFIHFNTKQAKKSDLQTHKYPASHNEEAYWITDDIKGLFGKCNISDEFKNSPQTIDKLLCFDKNLFFNDEELQVLSTFNPTYNLSKRALLWNLEKYDSWLERRKEEEINSRLDWEAREEADKLQIERQNSQDFPNEDEQNYFNAMTDGHLGDFTDHSGDINEIDDWAGK